MTTFEAGLRIYQTKKGIKAGLAPIVKPIECEECHPAVGEVVTVYIREYGVPATGKLLEHIGEEEWKILTDRGDTVYLSEGAVFGFERRIWSEPLIN